MRSRLTVCATVAALLLVAISASAGQQPPLIDGVTGTLAPESTVQKTYEGVNSVVARTADGIEHLFHRTERIVVHGGTEAAEQALRGLEEGSRVVVHETVKADQKTTHDVGRAGDLKETKGVITLVDRRAKTIVIRLADGTRQTFRLTERAASDVGSTVDGVAIRTRGVVISFSDEAGRHVAHYFTRVS
jgi:hypothetical protein